MSDGEHHDAYAIALEYDPPISDTRTHRQIAFQPLDLIAERERIKREHIERPFHPAANDGIERIKFWRSFRREDDAPPRPQAGFFSATTLCSVSSALSKKRFTPRAA